MGTTVSVVSWNVWWRFGPWEERLPAIVATLAAIDPDVACLQEVWDDGERRQAAELAEALGDGRQHAYGSRIELNGVAFGNAVVSRWPIASHEVRALPGPPAPELDEHRCVVRADIDGPRGPLQVFSTHLNRRFDQSHVRQAQVREVARFVRESGEATPRSFPPVLCGDFNATPTSDEVRMLTGRTAVPEAKLVFHDAWEAAGDGSDGFTWSNDNPWAPRDLEPARRIDYVLAGWPKQGERGHVVSCRVIGTEPVDGVFPSDHYGLVAELRY
ncbi:MAG: endonuclease/exonuclease/phosphatase family protein [Acidimicrobiales bacterium]